MLSWRRKRQLSYILGLILFFSTIIGLSLTIIYWPEKEDPCPYGVCPWDIVPLNFLWSKAIQVQDDLYSIIAFYENKNKDLGVPFFRYRLRLTNNNLEELAIFEGENFINPRDMVILFADRIKLSEAPTQIFIDFPEELSWRRLEITPPALTGSIINFTNEPFPQLTARVNNDAIFGFDNIRVPVVISNDQREAIAISQTYIDHISRAGHREIFYTWPQSFEEGQAVFFDIYPRLNLFEID